MSDRVVPLFNCRAEEVAPLARLLRAHYQEDEAEFVDLLPEEYGKQFLTDFDARLAAVEQAVSRRSATGLSQQLGQQVQTQLDELPRQLNRLEARVRRAEGLQVSRQAFGIRQVRAALDSKDVEAVAETLRVLLQNLDANAAALQAKGHLPAETEQLRALRTALTSGSTAQDVAQTTQQTLTQTSTQVLNRLYQLMQELMADGKSLYRGVDAAKVKHYTLAQLLKRVRREREEKPGGPA
ncbi:hypothetical protein EJV47_09495 [Hymenobacter gummosus]|uniref:Uncharacterized protein n=1 Tax=Hymenobacter gummosus TaxID=1776032 RepID=A0A3S0K6K5_9BACT|nr:hypothetical protein [Hymenobacter gummosus]RTQ50840.1 hypothetical protein EJV47_09495 [Hymenobacter gummosus]